MKKELNNNNNYVLKFIFNMIDNARYAADIADILNNLMKNGGDKNGLEQIKFFYEKKIKNLPERLKPFFKINEGIFVGYAVGTDNFVSIEDFLKNSKFYLKMTEEIKEKEKRRMDILQERIRINSDYEYRFEKLEEYKVSTLSIKNENLRKIVEYGIEKGLLKFVSNNPLISAYISGEGKNKKFIVMKAFWNNRVSGIAKISPDTGKTELFPGTVGYSFFGFKEYGKKCFFADNLFEVAEFLNNNFVLNSKEFFLSFLYKNKFVIMNNMFLSSYSRLYKELLEEKTIKDFVGKSEICVIKNQESGGTGLNFFVSDFSRSLKREEKDGYPDRKI